MKVDCDARKITVGQTNLAKALNLSRQRITQLIQENVIMRDESDPTGGVFLFDSLRSYYLKQADKNGDDYFKIKAEHEEVKKQLSELKLREREGELYEATEVEAALAEIISVLRTNMLSLPAKVSGQFEGAVRAQVNALMTAEIEDALLEVSNYRPEAAVNEELGVRN